MCQVFYTFSKVEFYVSSDNRPRVFDEGCITVSLNSSLLNIYIGTLDLSYVKSLEILSEDGSDVGPRVILKFLKSFDPDISQKIEENIRLAKTLPWIHIEEY